MLERRVVREDTGHVLVDAHAGLEGLDDDATGLVRDDPVQLASGQILREAVVRDVHDREQTKDVIDGPGLAKKIGDELEGRDVLPPLLKGVITGVPDEIEAGDREARLVHRVVIKRGIPGQMGHAEDGVMAFQALDVAKGNRVVAWQQHDRFPVGEFVVEVPPKIRMDAPIEDSGAHGRASFFIP